MVQPKLGIVSLSHNAIGTDFVLGFMLSSFIVLAHFHLKHQRHKYSHNFSIGSRTVL